MAQAPQKRERGLPGLPPDFKLFALQATKGLNTKDSRSSIEDEETSWQENLIRIGAGKLRSVYDVGTAIYTAGGGLTVISFYPFNIGSTFYHAVFLSDGTAVQVRLSDGAQTVISAVANTFWQAGRERPACTQWGAQFLLILTVDNYWIWDGAILYGAGTLSPNVLITRAGHGYTSAPTVVAHGGSGTGATFTATVLGGSVTEITVTNPGSGYVAGDFVALDFSGGGGSTTAIITPVLTGTKVTSLTITNGGTGYGNGGTTPVPTLTIVGGGGTGATAVVTTMVAGVITVVTLSTQGDGYTSVPTVLVQSAAADNNKLAEAIVLQMPFGVTGTAIETFQSRVWLTKDDTITFSAPASNDNFSTSSGGGTVQSTDNFLKVNFPALRQANGYLYPFGDSSIQVISNVQSFGSPVTTTFNNSNTDPEIGTPWRDTVQAFGRALMFANENGIYGLFGGTAEKMSDKLDGIFLAIPNRAATSTGEPSSCLATIFDIRCYCCLIPIIDPFTGLQRNAMVCWDGKTWFVASQTKSLTFIATEMKDSTPIAWGTDGATIFPIFDTADTTLTKTLQSKLWSGDSFIVSKQTIGLYTQTEDNSGVGVIYDVTIDSEVASEAIVVSSGSTVSWVNNSAQLCTWINNGSVLVTWGATGILLTSQNIDSLYGYLIGLTLNSTSEDFTIIALAIGYRTFSSMATSAVRG